MDNYNFEKEGLLSSFSTIKPEVDVLQDLEILITTILESVFNNKQKQTVNKFSNRFSFSCPYCGDSEKNTKLKRGNIYFKSFGFHCFNCGKHTSVYSLLKDYNNILRVDLSTFIGLKNVYTEELELKGIHNNQNILDSHIDELLLPKNELESSLKFISVDGTPAERFLKNRMQHDFNRFAYESGKIDHLIIYNLTSNNKVFGFQKRALDNKIKNRYASYKLSGIYNEMKKEINEEVTNLDHLSLIFNIMNVDYNKKITIFEGPLDSFLFPNSIALSGIHKNLNVDIEKKRFWLDNDKIGREKSIELLESGEEIFLWHRFLKDYDIKKEIKDLNDLILILRKKKIQIYPAHFEKYFSNNKMDLYGL